MNEKRTKFKMKEKDAEMVFFSFLIYSILAVDISLMFEMACAPLLNSFLNTAVWETYNFMFDFL